MQKLTFYELSRGSQTGGRAIVYSALLVERMSKKIGLLRLLDSIKLRNIFRRDHIAKYPYLFIYISHQQNVITEV